MQEQERLLYEGRWLRMKSRGRWEFAERVRPGGAALILAISDDDCLLLVEQLRVAVARRTIELPAGLVGDTAEFAGESLAAAALRELEEETGYRAERVEALHSGPSSAGMSNEIIHYVRAHGLHKVGSGGGDASEDITVHEVPLAGVPRWLAERAAEGLSVDLKLLAGLWLLDHPSPGNAAEEWQAKISGAEPDQPLP